MPVVRRRENDRLQHLARQREVEQAAAATRAAATPVAAGEPFEAGGYPFTENAYLHASDLNAALEGNPGSNPPTNVSGQGPNAYKLWFDNTFALPVQRWWDGVEGVAAAAIDPANHLWMPLLGGGVTTLASAATVDLGSVPHTMIRITGTTSITSFGSNLQEGTGKLLLFIDALTIVAGSSMMLVGTDGGGTATNITTTPGDMAFAWSLGSGRWGVAYMPVDVISDAPSDGFVYGRSNQSWLRVQAPADLTLTLTGDVTGFGSVTTIPTTLATTTANPGTFQGLTIDARGLVTAASNQSYLTGNQTVTISGDVTGSGATAITATLPSVNPNTGTFQGLTVNAKGQVTAAADMAYAPLSALPVVPGPSTTLPLMDGTAEVGAATTWTPADHVHPTDTSRYAASNPAGYQTAAQVTAALPVASSTPPHMDGTAAAGTGTTWARADHVHPTDTSLAPIMGVTDGSEAAAGEIGEYLVVSNVTGIALASNTPTQVCVISLTAGEWHIWGTVDMTPPGNVSPNMIAAAVSLYPNALPSQGDLMTGVGVLNMFSTNALTAGQQQVLFTGICRSNSNAPLDLYLVAQSAWTGAATVTTLGYICARRVR